MERNTLHPTEIRFCSTETEDAVFTLSIEWSDDTTHALVAVNNLIGQLQDVMVLTRNKVTKLTWSGFSNSRTYIVQVYGLKLDTTTGQAEGITLYSVEGVQKFMINSPLMQIGTKVADLTQTQRQDHMINSLGEQTEFEIEAEHEPPMDHRLKPTLPPGSTTGLYVVYNEKTKKEFVMMSSLFCHSSSHSCDDIPLLPIQQSRTEYKVLAIALKNTVIHMFGSCHGSCGKSKLLTIKSCNSKDDLQMLMDKAQDYCRSHSRSPGTYPIRQFYRNEPRQYYDDILNDKGGIMTKYTKDNNGDPYCPINSQIDGLFFSASLVGKKRQKPRFSFFGDRRLFVPAEELITPDTRMYFSDFYCHAQVHYVTVVLTKRGSSEDRFCKDHLLKLNLQDNSFFTVQENASIVDSSFSSSSLPQLVMQKTFKMASVDKFHVEFLYTEDVDIAGLIAKCGDGHSKNNVYFTETRVRGRGKSKKNGIPKKESCKICNLDIL